MTKSKDKFLLGYNMEVVIKWGNKNLVRGVYWGNFSWWRRDE